MPGCGKRRATPGYAGTVSRGTALTAAVTDTRIGLMHEVTPYYTLHAEGLCPASCAVAHTYCRNCDEVDPEPASDCGTGELARVA